MVAEFGGLDTISKQSVAFHLMAHKSAAEAERKVLGKTGKTVMYFTKAYESEVQKAKAGLNVAV